MNKHAAPPEFAMSFTQEAVLLEQRQGRDWRPLGQAYFAGREMAAKLHALRDEAGGASGDLDTILVIPDDQILYTTLTVPFGSDTAAIIGRALEGMTPYKTTELAFDWCPAENGEIETLRVAAVARRTLEEAEDFARAQGFHPAGFIARPGDNRFEGDPEFGPSRLAQEQLTRHPFSEPDLSQARITDPVIADAPVPSEPAPVVETAASKVVAEEAEEAMTSAAALAASEPVEPAKATETQAPVAAVTVSRIIAHHVHVAAAEPKQSKPDAIARLQAAVENVKAANSETPTNSELPTNSERAAQQAVKDELVEIDAQEPAEDAEGLAIGVIRHGARKAPSTQGLSPRAQAVHSRAREAKALRAEQSDVEPAIAAPSLLTRVRNLNPSRLTMMIGGLAVLVLVVLIFFGGRGDDVPVAQTEPASEQVVATPATQDAIPEQDVVQEGALDDVGTAEAEFADQNLPAAAASEGETAQSETAAAPIETIDESSPPVAPADLATDQAAPAEAITDAQQQAAATAATAATTAVAAPSVTTSRPPAARPAQQPAAAAEPERNAAQMALGNDTLSRALNDAIVARDAQRAAAAAEAARQQTISAATMTGDLANAPRSRSIGQATATPTPAAAPAPTTRQPRLASSARPPRATPARATQTATDRQPTVPANPQPYAQRTQPEPSRLTGNRPPERPATQRRAAEPVVTPAAAAPAAAPAATTQPATRPAASSPRPPSRPDRQTMLEEGSTNEDAAPTKLTADERLFLENLLLDLRTAQVGANGLTQAERGALIRLADARPTRRPLSVGATSEQAVRDAVAAAVADTDRPTPRTDAQAAPPSMASASSSAGLGSSTRPMARPGNRTVASGNDPGPGNSSLSKAAVEDAIASAVASSPSQPGAVPLTALTSSAIPGRRPGGGRAAASAVADAVSLAATSSNAPTAADLRAAAEAQSADELAAQRRADDDLQRQAEERARQFAAADARAEAQARAAAEARARAQAEAEAANAARRQQAYQPPEAESEPEVAAADLPDGRTPTTAGNAATVERGIQLNRTQIIGTIGAGRASRALVRLSNGRVLTLRIGDKINGGTISAIGDSRITYVRGGRQQQLSVLGGR
ncbi:hypothetical protein H4P12_09930 [Paracoccus sp. 11-3]|uniref:Meckel syndrome type 1 protein n=1 Tax=Paracoccus amoyensis TaxID=2760093 RepID=A0A926JCL6_9RHOB|nr:hypothetical protein [Paracoccus amoyensis]MBC9247030.1 hypothetical protein [Paracoccus amoyensis]